MLAALIQVQLPLLIPGSLCNLGRPHRVAWTTWAAFLSSSRVVSFHISFVKFWRWCLKGPKKTQGMLNFWLFYGTLLKSRLPIYKDPWLDRLLGSPCEVPWKGKFNIKAENKNAPLTSTTMRYGCLEINSGLTKFTSFILLSALVPHNESSGICGCHNLIIQANDISAADRAYSTSLRNDFQGCIKRVHMACTSLTRSALRSSFSLDN
jgi:hypothetical protein